jgi:hypothetical protein
MAWTMFCPKCKIEYKEGFRQCPQCGTCLAGQSLKAVSDCSGDNEFVEVYSTYHQDDISFLKSILDGEDIAYFFQGESSIMLIAAGAYARLMVKAGDVQRAREILQDLGFIETPDSPC